MASKLEIIKMLKTAIDFEEKCVPLLHDKCLECFQEITHSEMIEEDKRKMRQMLNELVSDAREHRLALEELVAKISEGDQNEF